MGNNHGVDDAFIRKRITELRLQMGVAEYRMSKDLGHAKGYINNIAAGNSMPAVTELLKIIDYLGVTPKEFFDTEAGVPDKSQKKISWVKKKVIRQIENLNDDKAKSLSSVIDSFTDNNDPDNE
jgi:transcriptional regulator with XRE-family HTH domain